MSLDTAITAKDNLRKAIKAGRTECHAIAANIRKIVDEALWEYLDLPSGTPGDKLLALITLPDQQGGLNCRIDEFYALISIQKDVERQVRKIINQASQGERNDLKPEPKVEAKISKAKKPKGASDSNKATERAAEAVPALDKLLNEGLVSKRNAAKVGQTIKDSENPTEEEAKLMEQREQLSQKLAEVIPDPLPEAPQERKELRKQVKDAIEQTTGKVTPKKISLVSDPRKVAEAIAKANNDLEFLQDLEKEIGLIVDSLQPALQAA